MGINRQREALTNIAANVANQNPATAGKRSTTAEILLQLSRTATKEPALIVETVIVTTRNARIRGGVEDIAQYNEGLQTFSTKLSGKIAGLATDQKDFLTTKLKSITDSIEETNKAIEVLRQAWNTLDQKQKTILASFENTQETKGIFTELKTLRTSQDDLLEQIERLRSSTSIQVAWQDLVTLNSHANSAPRAKTGASLPDIGEPPPRLSQG